MNIRVRFRKYGALKFIGHLDVMRYFQKAIRRAGIDICFSEGFSPHMIMSFAAPLGVGLTSDGEYMDIRVKTPLSSAEALERLNAAMAEGIEAMSFRMLPENSKNAMSIVAAADYEIRFRDGHEPGEGWQERWREFLSLPSMPAIKETKKGRQEIDLRPLIFRCEIRAGAVFLQACAGSGQNLKPELLIQAFGDWASMDIPADAYTLHRMELYARQGTEEERGLITLEALGEDIG